MGDDKQIIEHLRIELHKERQVTLRQSYLIDDMKKQLKKFLDLYIESIELKASMIAKEKSLKI